MSEENKAPEETEDAVDESGTMCVYPKDGGAPEYVSMSEGKKLLKTNKYQDTPVKKKEAADK